MESISGASGWPWNDSPGLYSLQTQGVSSQGAGQFLRGEDISSANDQIRLEDVDRNEFLKDSCGPQASVQSADFGPSEVSFGSP
jgi:hypothetical protein